MVGIASVSRYKISVLRHLPIVLAAFINRRPDGNYRFDSHFFQFPHHSFRVRPVSGFKPEIALHCPVEEVYHDGIHGQPSSLMLSRYRQQFLLIAVTQLTLPVAQTILRHQRRPARSC